VLGVLILLAAAPSASMPLLDATTSRPIDEFGACFAERAEKAGRAWAYLPSARGGTFTDSGAEGAAASYWLQVRPKADSTRLRLFAAVSAQPADVLAAVRVCR
jgi:hypothetical protein